MTTTINASTSAGLVQTADTSGILQLQTAGTAAVTIDASQNVGIGTTSPAGKLDVSGNIYVSGKQITNGPGMWRVQPEIVFKTLRSQLLGEGQHCIMKDRASNSFSYIDDKTIEPVIFKKVYTDKSIIERRELPFQEMINALQV